MNEPYPLHPDTLNTDYQSAAWTYLNAGWLNCCDIISHYPEPANIDLVFTLRDRIAAAAASRFPGETLGRVR